MLRNVLGLLSVFVALSITGRALGQVSPQAGALVFNEYNAVSTGKTLKLNILDKPWEGHDSFFNPYVPADPNANPPIDGNGGNWVELVVTQDHLNIQGWSLVWTDNHALPDNTGSVVFNDNPVWGNLRAGTIITLRETDIGNPNGWDISHPVGSPGSIVASDASFAPQQNDWWIQINEEDPTYIASHHFRTNNNDWAGTLKDAQNRVVMGPVGEKADWGGAGLGSDEAAVSDANPITSAATGFDFEDNDYSTFGSLNHIFGDTTVQDVSGLRTWYTRTDRIAGDANLDRVVDIQDLYILATNFNTSGHTWMDGDFDGNGIVDANDLGLLSPNWLQTFLPSEPLPQALAEAFRAVPEPASITVLLIPTLLLGRRGRKG